MRHLCTSLTLSLSLLLSVPAAWPQTYRMTPLGRLTAYDLNAGGAFTGTLRQETPPECEPDDTEYDPACFPPTLPAFVSRVGKLHTLNESGGHGNAVSQNGRVAFEAEGAWFTWTPSAGTRPLANTSGGQTEVLRFTNNKQMVGSLETGPSSVCAARWKTPTSEPTCIIPAVNAQLGWAFDGNAHGVIVGSHDHYPFRDRPGQKPEIFYDQPGQVFIAINDDGTILRWDGLLIFPSGQTFAVPGLPGCTNPLALDLNASLQVVGSSLCPEGERAWVWSFSAGTVDLTTASGSDRVLSFPHRINDKGQILVEADWTAEEGDSVLLTPTPRARVARR